MEARRRNSKGGLFQLFDWNSKSRKKLFSSKSDIAYTETSKQGNQNVAKLLNYQQLGEAHENGRTDIRSDDCIPPSMATDDGYRTKAPSVVARLMGLDCLPTSAAPGTASTPFLDPSFSSNNCSRSSSSLSVEYHQVNNNPSMRGHNNLVDPRLPKVQNRAIKRFQSEILPPKSAKPNPIAHHHRLLSPIKNPGFIPTNDLAYIMKASSKIMEQCPQSAVKKKTLNFASSSVPLRIRDVKERMEAVPRATGHPEALRRSKEPVVSKCNRDLSKDKIHSGSIDLQTKNGPRRLEKETFGRLKNKGKSVSLAVQAKVNVQRKEGFLSGDSRRSVNHNEAVEVKNRQHNQCQRTMQKNIQKRNAVSRTADVLKQNNQKQNCVNPKEKLPPTGSVPTKQKRKSEPVNGSVRTVKALSKVLNPVAGSRKINSMEKNNEKEIISSKTKTFSEKKQIGCGNMHIEDSVGDSIPTITSKDHNKHIKCNIVHDGSSNCDADERQSSMNIVSFAYTSPTKKTHTVSGTSGQLMENGITYGDDMSYGPKIPTLYSPSSNVTGGDALSVFLEQKLKGLTCRVESPYCYFDNAGNASSTFNAIDATPEEECIDFEVNFQKAKSSTCDVASSFHGPMCKANGKWKELREIEGKSNGSSICEYGKERDFQYASLSSTFELSSTDGSSDSSELNSVSTTKGSKVFHLTKPHGMMDCISNGASQSIEVDFEFSDSASSSPVAHMNGYFSSPMSSLIEFKRSPNWDLEYITKILFSSELVVDDLVLGQVNKLLTPNLFEHLENLQIVCPENTEENLKLERKVLFDCVGECLDSRGEQLLGGNCKALSKWGTLFQKKVVLAYDLCNEICSRTTLRELMPDELVDKDMSSGRGKWLEFEAEVLEAGVEIESAIFSSLVDELVNDFLLV